VSKFHNNKSGEKLALSYHAFGIVTGLTFAGFSLVVAVMFEPFVEYAALLHRLGLYTAFLGMWISAIVSVFMNLAQVIWHVIACREHQQHAQELSS
jgi:hypothetical protein